MLINVPAVITQQGSELGGGEDKHFPIRYLLLISGGIKKKKKTCTALFLRDGESVLCGNRAALGASGISAISKINPEI